MLNIDWSFDEEKDYIEQPSLCFWYVFNKI